MTVLKPVQASPFSGSWSEWYTPEANVGLLFETMVGQLEDTWNEQCRYGVPADHDGGIRTPSGRTVDHSRFDPGALAAPGIHREVDEDGHEDYHVVVPVDYLRPEACESWVERLNEVYDRNLELTYDLDS